MNLLDIPSDMDEDEYITPAPSNRPISSLSDAIINPNPVSQEWGLGYQTKMAEAFEKEATNNSISMTVDKKTQQQLNKEHDDEVEKKEAEERERDQNRQEAIMEAADGLKEAARATGKGLKETARIAYNLVLGKKVRKSEDKDD